MYVIGIDLGGTKICDELADLDGNMIGCCTVPTNAFEGDKAVLGRIINASGIGAVALVITES